VTERGGRESKRRYRKGRRKQFSLLYAGKKLTNGDLVGEKKYKRGEERLGEEEEMRKREGEEREEEEAEEGIE
jgi:hypothetical protein